MNLEPIYLALFSQKSDLDRCLDYNIMSCMECGSCSYICMGRLHLVQMFKKTKGQILEAKRKAK